MQKKALDGVKVADFTWAAAGPLTIKYLAHNGATVVKIESATRLDGSRTFPPNKDGQAGQNRSLLYSEDNSNKLSMNINLNHPEGLEVAKKLIAWADIVAENFRPGTMEKWGLGYEEFKKINPSVILFRSSAQGQTRTGFKMGATGITLQSLTGFTYLTGWTDKIPSPPWAAYTDLTVPAMGAAMLIGALDFRNRTGRGQCIDLSQFEASLHYLAPAILDYFANGRVAVRQGNSCSYAAPHGVYRCKGNDRWCSISVFSGEEWLELCRVMEKNELAGDPRFATVINRKENENELNRIIEQWTVKYSPETIMTLLQKNGISAGVIENSEDLFKDPQIQERGSFKKLDHEEIGRFSHRNLPFKLSKTPCDVTSPGPLAGQHTEMVCREFLKMSDNEFVRLLNAGALE